MVILLFTLDYVNRCTDLMFSFYESALNYEFIIISYYHSLVKARCGGPVRKTHGTIQSPKYPSWYPENKECVWTIELPSKVSQINQ